MPVHHRRQGSPPPGHPTRSDPSLRAVILTHVVRGRPMITPDRVDPGPQRGRDVTCRTRCCLAEGHGQDRRMDGPGVRVLIASQLGGIVAPAFREAFGPGLVTVAVDEGGVRSAIADHLRYDVVLTDLTWQHVDLEFAFDGLDVLDIVQRFGRPAPVRVRAAGPQRRARPPRRGRGPGRRGGNRAQGGWRRRDSGRGARGGGGARSSPRNRPRCGRRSTSGSRRTARRDGSADGGRDRGGAGGQPRHAGHRRRSARATPR